MGYQYTEHLERALAETTKSHTELAEKLAIATAELNQCIVDLFEAEDKFHVLSFYIKDKQAYDCAKNRTEWMNKAIQRVRATLARVR